MLLFNLSKDPLSSLPLMGWTTIPANPWTTPWNMLVSERVSKGGKERDQIITIPSS